MVVVVVRMHRPTEGIAAISIRIVCCRHLPERTSPASVTSESGPGRSSGPPPPRGAPGAPLRPLPPFTAAGRAWLCACHVSRMVVALNIAFRAPPLHVHGRPRLSLTDAPSLPPSHKEYNEEENVQARRRRRRNLRPSAPGGRLPTHSQTTNVPRNTTRHGGTGARARTTPPTPSSIPSYESTRW